MSKLAFALFTDDGVSLPPELLDGTWRPSLHLPSGLEPSVMWSLHQSDGHEGAYVEVRTAGWAWSVRIAGSSPGRRTGLASDAGAAVRAVRAEILAARETVPA